jgi:signal transduction histidine kinase
MVGVIHRLAEKVEEEGIECDLNIPDEFPRISLAQEKTFYWFILESLTNIRKHARATRARINIEHANNRVSISIVDNGIGFDLEQVMKSRVSLEHIGLLGMTERADYLNGDFDIKSIPGEGTTVNLSFSLNPTGNSITSEDINE